MAATEDRQNISGHSSKYEVTEPANRTKDKILSKAGPSNENIRVENGGVKHMSDIRVGSDGVVGRSIFTDGMFLPKGPHIMPPPRYSKKANQIPRISEADVESSSDSEAHISTHSRRSKEIMPKKKSISHPHSSITSSDDSEQNVSKGREYRPRQSKTTKPNEPALNRLPSRGHQLPLNVSNKLLERSKKTLLSKVINEFDHDTKTEVLKVPSKAKRSDSSREPPKRRPKRGKRKRGPPIEASVIIANTPVANSPRNLLKKSSIEKQKRNNVNKVPVTRIDGEDYLVSTSHIEKNDHSASMGDLPTPVNEELITQSRVDKQPAIKELGNDLNMLLEEHKQIRNRLQSCLDTTTNNTRQKPMIQRSKTDTSIYSRRKDTPEDMSSPRSFEATDVSVENMETNRSNAQVSSASSASGQLSIQVRDQVEHPPNHIGLMSTRDQFVHTKAQSKPNPLPRRNAAKRNKNSSPDYKPDLLHRFYANTDVGHILNPSNADIRAYLEGKVAKGKQSPRKSSDSSKDDQFSSPHKKTTKRYQGKMEPHEILHSKLVQKVDRRYSDNQDGKVHIIDPENLDTNDPRGTSENNNVPINSKHIGRLNSTAYELATALNSPPGSDHNSKPSTNTSFFHVEGQSIKSYADKSIKQKVSYKSLTWCPTWIYVVFYFVLWTFIVKLMDGIEGNGPTKCTMSEEIRQWSCIFGVTLLYGVTELYFEGKAFAQGLFCMVFMAVLILISHSQPLSCRFHESNIVILSYIQAGHNFLLAAMIGMYRIYYLRKINRRRNTYLGSIDAEGTVDSIVKTEDEDDSLFTFKDLT